MVQKTRLASSLGLGAVLLAGGIAHAQTGAPGGPPSSYPSAPGAPSAMTTTTTTTTPGAVNNQLSTDSSTTVSSSSTNTLATDDSTLKATGGEPWLMAFGGLALAAGALTLRRRFN